jgi:CRP/FNR family transcriptional regulator, cyclic AMP receptor protein
MIERFQGDIGRANLIESLSNQKIVAGNVLLAQQIASLAELIEVDKHTTIIEQGAEDDDIFLIIAGSFDILVNGRKIARRFANDHIGEMAAIQPTQRRAASCTSTEKAVLCKLTGTQFGELGRDFPDVWRFIAKELARRLEQRNAHVSSTHDKIRLFIISSVEALEIARTIQNAFEYDFTVVVWTDGVFRASWYPVESLERQLDQSDFAIAIAQPDDTVVSRGRPYPAARDNVIFELGLFIGRIGRRRSFLIEPRGEELTLPSDLSGITALSYKFDPDNLAAAMGPACNCIRTIIKELGPNN